MNTEDLKPIFSNFYKSLNLLNPNKITLVKIDVKNQIEYQQIGNAVRIPKLNFIYLYKNFEYGILLPDDLDRLKSNLKVLLTTDILERSSLLVVPEILITRFYLTILPNQDSHLSGPKEVLSLKYLSSCNNLTVLLASIKSKELNYLIKLNKDVSKRDINNG